MAEETSETILARLRGTVLSYDEPTEPVWPDDCLQVRLHPEIEPLIRSVEGDGLSEEVRQTVLDRIRSKQR